MEQGGKTGEWKNRFYLMILSCKRNKNYEITEENCYDQFTNVLDSSTLPFWMETDVLYLFSTTKTSRNHFALKNFPYSEAISMEVFENVIIKHTSRFSLILAGQNMSSGLLFNSATKAFDFFEVATKAKNNRQIYVNGLSQGIDVDLRVLVESLQDNQIRFNKVFVERLIQEKIRDFTNKRGFDKYSNRDLQAVIELLDQLLMGFHQWPKEVDKKERKETASYLAGRFLDLVAEKFQDSESNKVRLKRKLW